MPSVLICDDDLGLCNLLKDFLEEHDIKLTAIHSGQELLKKIKNDFIFDLLILDVMLPDYNGLELLKKIKSEKEIPVIMLSGRGEPLDKVFGLDQGADDYLGKPCLPRELLSRIQAVLRRNSNKDISIVEYAGLEINNKTNQVFLNKKEIYFTPIEFKVLLCFVKNAGKTLPKTFLVSEVWGKDFSQFERSLDMHVSNIRTKLTPDFKILGLRSQGYKFFNETLENHS